MSKNTHEDHQNKDHENKIRARDKHGHFIHVDLNNNTQVPERRLPWWARPLLPLNGNKE